MSVPFTRWHSEPKENDPEDPMATEAQNVKEGDVVTLRSGGPEMTVEKLECNRGEFRYLCTWFVNGRQMSAAFKPSSLAKS